MSGATWTVYLNNIDDKESNVLLRMASQVGRQCVLAENWCYCTGQQLYLLLLLNTGACCETEVAFC